MLTTRHVQRAVEGDVSSLAWIVRHFSPLLLAQARYRLAGKLQSLYEPEDIVNDVWQRVLPRLESFAVRGDRRTPALLTYLTRSLRNRLADLYEKHFFGKPQVAPDGEEPRVAELEASVTGVMTAAVRKETGGQVLAAIEALGESDRALVVLRGIEQMTNVEVAELLQIEPGTAAVRYHRALKKLEGMLPSSVVAELASE